MSDLLSRKLVIGLLLLLYLPYVNVHGYKHIGSESVGFRSVYAASKIAFARGAAPYAPDAFADSASLIGEPAPAAPPNRIIPPYPYSPPSLLLVYPLTFFAFTTARFLLLALSHTCVLSLFYLVVVKIIGPAIEPPIRNSLAPLCLLYLLVFHPVIANFQYGDIDIIILSLLCLTWYAVKTERAPAIIALPLLVAVLLNVSAAVCVAFLMIRRKFRATGWVVAGVSVAALLAFAVLPREVWADWIANVLPAAGYVATPADPLSAAQPHNHSINGFIWRLSAEQHFTDALVAVRDVIPLSLRNATVAFAEFVKRWTNLGPAGLLTCLLSLGVIGVTVLACYRSARKNGARRDRLIDLEFSLFLATMVLVAPNSSESQLVFLLPAALLAIHILLVAPHNRFYQAAAASSLCILAWNLSLETPAWQTGLWTMIVPIKFYAVAFIWCFFVGRVWNSDELPPPPFWRASAARSLQAAMAAERRAHRRFLDSVRR
ncbi:MAG TPA: glycosyltransferase family 87 protein [Chthoniobacterales bacterium]|nr:glycosyltransferase family 87 protein [Chthoniobacterales bacterium]